MKHWKELWKQLAGEVNKHTLGIRALQCLAVILMLSVVLRYGYYDWMSKPHEVKATHRMQADSRDPLAGKTLLFIGDSICYGVEADGEGYPTWVKNYHPGAHVYNKGLGGMPVGFLTRNPYSLPARIGVGEFEEFKEITDYVFLQGGINDVIMGIPAGELAKGSEILSVDSFCGGLEYAFKYFTEEYPNAKVYFLSTYPCKAQDLSLQEELWQVAEAACEKWNVTYLDVYSAIPVEMLEGDYDTWLHAPMTVHRDLIYPIIGAILGE